MSPRDQPARRHPTGFGMPPGGGRGTARARCKRIRDVRGRVAMHAARFA